ncbi:EF-hand domain-containing protein D2-like [Ciona intestinalis]
MSELADRLAKRREINEGDVDAPALNIEPKSATYNSGEKDTVDAADNELANKLKRQGNINDGMEVTQNPSVKNFNPYTEFKEFTRAQIKNFRKKFDLYDTSRDGVIDFMELKVMMEKLEAPQTHLALKAMIKEVDEDMDMKISFREFLLIFRKAACGELQVDGLKVLADMPEINVGEEGVKGAKNFFQAKADKIAETNKFEREIKEEQEIKKKELEEKKQRRIEFKAKANLFK